jgi:hypothetical protein
VEAQAQRTAARALCDFRWPSPGCSAALGAVTRAVRVGGPAACQPVPLQDAAVGDAAVGSRAVAVERNTLRATQQRPAER